PRPRHRPRTLPQNPLRGRARHGHHGRVPLPLEPSHGHQTRPRPRRIPTLLVRGPPPRRQHRRPRHLRGRHRRPHHRQRTPLHPLVLPRSDGPGRGPHHHARPQLGRRHRRSQEDRRHGRVLPTPDRPPRLHRPHRPHGLDAPLPQRPQRPHPGNCPRL